MEKFSFRKNYKNLEIGTTDKNIRFCKRHWRIAYFLGTLVLIIIVIYGEIDDFWN